MGAWGGGVEGGFGSEKEKKIGLFPHPKKQIRRGEVKKPKDGGTRQPQGKKKRLCETAKEKGFRAEGKEKRL